MKGRNMHAQNDKKVSLKVTGENIGQLLKGKCATLAP
jgi:hypothetical protein